MTTRPKRRSRVPVTPRASKAKATSAIAIAIAIGTLLASCTTQSPTKTGATHQPTSRSNARQNAPGPAHRIGQAFLDGQFKVTVLAVTFGRRTLPFRKPRSGGPHWNPPRPLHGQFVLVHISATNTSKGSLRARAEGNVLVATDGTKFTSANWPGLQAFGTQWQAPGQTLSGYLVFDVPPPIQHAASLTLRLGTSPATVTLRKPA